MKIHPVRYDGNKYCGPAAISAIKGCTTSEAAAMIRAYSGRKSIKGTTIGEVFWALKRSGFDLRTLLGAEDPNPTLAGWLRNSKAIRTAGRVFLVVVGNHWAVISGRRYVCGQTREIVSVKHERVKRRARVTRVCEVWRA
jgi:hypothetical protein